MPAPPVGWSGVHQTTAGGGAEAPGDPAAAAPTRTGHAAGESHILCSLIHARPLDDFF